MPHLLSYLSQLRNSITPCISAFHCCRFRSNQSDRDSEGMRLPFIQHTVHPVRSPISARRTSTATLLLRTFHSSFIQGRSVLCSTNNVHSFSPISARRTRKVQRRYYVLGLLLSFCEATKHCKFRSPEHRNEPKWAARFSAGRKLSVFCIVCSRQVWFGLSGCRNPGLPARNLKSGIQRSPKKIYLLRQTRELGNQTRSSSQVQDPPP